METKVIEGQCYVSEADYDMLCYDLYDSEFEIGNLNWRLLFWQVVSVLQAALLLLLTLHT